MRLVALALAVVLAGCASPETPGPAEVPAMQDVRAIGAACGNCFQPADLSIQAGQRVHWTGDSGSHTVSFEASPSGSGAPPDSGNLDPGQSYQLTFPVPGTFRYRCLYHSGDFGKAGEMVGSVVVG